MLLLYLNIAIVIYLSIYYLIKTLFGSGGIGRDRGSFHRERPGGGYFPGRLCVAAWLHLGIENSTLVPTQSTGKSRLASPAWFLPHRSLRSRLHGSVLFLNGNAALAASVPARLHDLPHARRPAPRPRLASIPIQRRSAAPSSSLANTLASPRLHPHPTPLRALASPPSPSNAAPPLPPPRSRTARRHRFPRRLLLLLRWLRSDPAGIRHGVSRRGVQGPAQDARACEAGVQGNRSSSRGLVWLGRSVSGGGDGGREAKAGLRAAVAGGGGGGHQRAQGRHREDHTSHHGHIR